LTANEELLRDSILSLFPTEGFAWESRYRAETDFNKFITGIAAEFARQKESNDQISYNTFPNTTELLEEWIDTFSLPPNPLLTEDQERARLKGHWRGLAKGSMQSANMEEIFSLSGFDVRVRPLTTGEDPTTYFIGDGKAVWGRAGAQFGDPDVRFGNIDAISEAFQVVNCGESQTIKAADTMFGKTDSKFGQGKQFGESLGYIRVPVFYGVTTDDRFWGMYYIIEDPNGDPLIIPPNLETTFRFLICLTKPQHMWAIVRGKVTGS
jgi:hypothetical protein